MAPQAEARDPSRRRHILVVDDNRDAANSLARLLTILCRQEVRVAYDGPSALEAAASFRPEVVLLDIELPGMDGYEVARNLRARPEFDGTMLVALTGWGQDEDRQRSKEAGFDRHLVQAGGPRRLVAAAGRASHAARRKNMNDSLPSARVLMNGLTREGS